MARTRTCAAALRRAAVATGWAAGLVCCFGLGSCVGPDFELPKPPEIAAFTAERLPASNTAGGKTQRLETGRQLPADYWTLFRSPALNALVERALRDNPNVDAAQAALRVAQANVYAEVGQLFPLATGEYSATGGKTASPVSSVLASGADYYTLHTAQLTVSYVPDVWGGTRRQIESLDALKDNQRFMNEATFLTLTSSVALGAIQEASLRGQIAVTERLIKIAKEILEKVRYQFNQGQVSQLDVATQEALVAQTEATLPPLRKALAVQRDALTVLSGHLPGEGLPERFEFAGLKLPRELPVSLPSDLIAQRPDVRAAEENMHAACALVGVAIANRLPQFTLTGVVGRQGTQFANSVQQQPRILLLHRACRCVADPFRRLHIAAKAARRGGGLRSDSRAIPLDRADRISECRRRPLCHPARYRRAAKSPSFRDGGSEKPAVNQIATGGGPSFSSAIARSADNLSASLADGDCGADEPVQRYGCAIPSPGRRLVEPAGFAACAAAAGVARKRHQRSAKPCCSRVSRCDPERSEMLPAGRELG